MRRRKSLALFRDRADAGRRLAEKLRGYAGTSAVALRARDVERVVVAVPVGSPEACEALASEADEVVCAEQTSDAEVEAVLTRPRSHWRAA